MTWWGLAPRGASAQGDADAQARAHFAAGSGYYAEGRFADAAREFERAFELSGRPGLLHNIYLARRDLGDQRGAADALRRYLAEAADIQPETRALLGSRLEALERSIAEQEAAEAAAADQAAAAPAQPAPAEEKGMGIVPGAVVLGAGGAVLAVSLVQGLRARHTRDEYDTICARSGFPDQCLASDAVRLGELADDFRRQRNSAWGLLAGGAATAGVGTVLLVLGLGGDGEPDATTADVSCSGDGCTLFVRGRF